MSPDEPIPGWNALQAAITTARTELIAAALDEESATDADAYLMRVVSANLADGFLNHLLAADGFMKVLPTRGGPNPDYLISHAAIDPSRRYRLEGWLHDSERVGIGLYSFTAEGVALLTDYAAFTRRNVDSEGYFALELAADATGTGTLQLTPGCRALIMRTLHRAVHGHPARLSLNGGPQSSRCTPAHGTTERTLMHVATMTLRSIRQFIRWSQLNSATPNRFTPPPPHMADEVQGDPDTHYSLGRYDLRDNEWLEVEIPQGARSYWSLHAYNHWCEYLPGATAHDLNTTADGDGLVRVHIGPTLPADVSNRIDTLGRRRGVLIFRTLGATEQSLPRTAVRSR